MTHMHNFLPRDSNNYVGIEGCQGLGVKGEEVSGWRAVSRLEHRYGFLVGPRRLDSRKASLMILKR